MGDTSIAIFEPVSSTGQIKQNLGSDLFTHHVGDAVSVQGIRFFHQAASSNHSMRVAWCDAVVSNHWNRTTREFSHVIGFLPSSLLPVVRGRNESYVPLYEFIAAWDNATDFDMLSSSLPSLSPGQIGGAIQFIRKFAQLNAGSIDIDALEDQEIESSPAFKEALLASFNDQSQEHVLNFSDTNF